MEKILPISLKLNLTPNTLGGYGLKTELPIVCKEYVLVITFALSTMVQPFPLSFNQ